MDFVKSLVGKTATFGRMIKFSHTVFALPFALAAVVIASRDYAITFEMVAWILAAMVGARSAAMGFNRLVDARFDARNPRTEAREIPTGKITVGQAVVFVVVSAALLILAAYMLNPLCFMLSPVALFLVFFYSYTKRFTSFAHLFLGLAIGVAPLGAWIAVTGAWDWNAFVLGVSVMFWIAGFDILYACQDYDFDKSENLFSVPKVLGIANAIWVARTLHAGAFGLFTFLMVLFGLGWIYAVGLGIVAMLLLYEHHLVKPHDLSRLDAAFFNMNGIISVLYLVFTTLDVFLPIG